MSSSNFIDHVKVYCRSGKGGAGSSHLHRAKFVPKGGPDGGDGGGGGNIIIRGNKQLWTLLHLRYTKHLIAENGKNGSSNNKTGSSGKDMVIEVPLGTVVKDSGNDEMLFEITQHDEEKTLLPGGMGGLGNTHFKSSVNRTPRYAQPGKPGTEKWVLFELKLLADVGLVGLPNAGKSTLLSVVTAAKPKIADYPFTTLTPNLGIVSYYDNNSFVMADIPGIIEGAHKGKGLGDRFLRHIERNAVLAFVISVDTENIKHKYELLLKELKEYNPELLDKSRLLVISKCDLVDKDYLNSINKSITGIEKVFISSHTNFGLKEMKDAVWQKLNMNNI